MSGRSLSVGWSGTTNQNVEPRSGWLITPICPPINSTRLLLIANPSPVPPYLRVVDESAWEKDWKSRSLRSAGIPMPVSETSNRIAELAGLRLGRLDLQTQLRRLR